jgi:hypothetical protein
MRRRPAGDARKASSEATGIQAAARDARTAAWRGEWCTQAAPAWGRDSMHVSARLPRGRVRERGSRALRLLRGVPLGRAPDGRATVGREALYRPAAGLGRAPREQAPQEQGTPRSFPTAPAFATGLRSPATRFEVASRPPRRRHCVDVTASTSLRRCVELRSPERLSQSAASQGPASRLDLSSPKGARSQPPPRARELAGPTPPTLDPLSRRARRGVEGGERGLELRGAHVAVGVGSRFRRPARGRGPRRQRGSRQGRFRHGSGADLGERAVHHRETLGGQAVQHPGAAADRNDQLLSTALVGPSELDRATRARARRRRRRRGREVGRLVGHHGWTRIRRLAAELARSGGCRSVRRQAVSKSAAPVRACGRRLADGALRTAPCGRHRADDTERTIRRSDERNYSPKAEFKHSIRRLPFGETRNRRWDALDRAGPSCGRAADSRCKGRTWGKRKVRREDRGKAQAPR